MAESKMVQGIKNSTQDIFTWMICKVARAKVIE
jgi:hypothetical protein